MVDGGDITVLTVEIYRGLPLQLLLWTLFHLYSHCKYCDVPPIYHILIDTKPNIYLIKQYNDFIIGYHLTCIYHMSDIGKIRDR